ncbi:MAG: DUF3180 domain-containing protein [Aeromicrobium sp.]
MNSVRRTSALSLTVLGGAGLVVGRLLRPVIEGFDGNAPRVGWSASLTLLLAAAVLGGIAWNTWQALHKRHERMTSDHGIKMLSLAKASALVGALFSGGYFGYALAFADAYDTPFGRERVVHGVVAGVAGVAMMIAALLLERALQVPGGPDKDGKGGTTQADATPA